MSHNTSHSDSSWSESDHPDVFVSRDAVGQRFRRHSSSLVDGGLMRTLTRSIQPNIISCCPASSDLRRPSVPSNAHIIYSDANSVFFTIDPPTTPAQIDESERRTPGTLDDMIDVKQEPGRISRDTTTEMTQIEGRVVRPLSNANIKSVIEPVRSYGPILRYGETDSLLGLAGTPTTELASTQDEIIDSHLSRLFPNGFADLESDANPCVIRSRPVVTSERLLSGHIHILSTPLDLSRRWREQHPIIEPYFNPVKLEQVAARAHRAPSHIVLDLDETLIKPERKIGAGFDLPLSSHAELGSEATRRVIDHLNLEYTATHRVYSDIEERCYRYPHRDSGSDSDSLHDEVD